MTRFTIITITYNAGKVVQRTLDSVLRQTYEGVDHILVDGASTDDTLKLLKAYKAMHSPRVRREAGDGVSPLLRSGARHKVIIQSEPDDGIYDAMNKGLTQASGDYVLFLNAGDCLPQADTLEQIARRCHLNELPTDELPAVLYGNTDIVDGEGRYLHPRRLQPPEKLTWRSFRHGMLVCHQAFYARTDIAKNLQYDTRYRYSADVDWCIRVMREAERTALPLININMVVACYTEEGATTRHHRKSLLERFDVMRRHYGLFTTLAMHLRFVVSAVRRSVSG